MVSEHGLENDPTLHGLYKDRASWIACYFKGIFCGRMTSTQRSESTNRMVKRNHLNESTPLHVFAKKMYQVLQKRKDDEGQQTIASQGHPDTKTNYPLERQLSRIYTRAVFKKYQEAYVAGTSFRIKKVDTCNFLVYYGREGPNFSWSQHEFKVVCNEVEEKYGCECRGWEHTGLLCSHLIIVLINEQIQKLPSKYVLRRYSRNAHIDLPYDRNDSIQTGPDGRSLSGRNSDLLREAYASVRAGNRSAVAYERALNVLRELRKQLEAIPPDEMPMRDEPAIDDEDVHLARFLKAPPKSSTKGSRAKEGAKQIIGARGPKLCTRECSNCGLREGHNKASCPNPRQTFAVGGSSAGRGRGRRGRGRGKNAKGKGVMRARRRLLDDVDEEDEDEQEKDDDVDTESSYESYHSD
uniref:Uncharacterized protein n=1 Tax=Avena sativa TaxID=4498 RepID=A0ACD5T8S0_AVESA